MYRNLISLMVCFTMLLLTPCASFAASDKGESTVHGPQKQLSTIVFAGLAGAILGLSTLSFYGRPQDRLNNIAVGAAVGIIGGAVFSTFKAATEPREFYNLKETAGHELWALQEQGAFKNQSPGTTTPGLGLKFTF